MDHEQLTKDLVREFSMLEFFRTLPDRRGARVAVRYADLEEVGKHAAAMYQNDPYFHACVDVAVAAARRVFSKYEGREDA